MPPGALPTFEITASSPLSQGIFGFGITTFAQLVLHVSTIPYGRTTSNSSLATLVENRGTCSSKHRLLAESYDLHLLRFPRLWQSFYCSIAGDDISTGTISREPVF